ncbi:MAG: hypothetical protein H8E89_07925 [Candidatus Nitrosopelagicus sp.]|nr:hypothetical protein [Candidatus Nitrosopelagicus sp.]
MNKESWAKTITIHRKKCEKILSFSKEIRYAGVFNGYGRTISGKIRPGIKPIFSPNAVREEFFAIASLMRLREKSSKGLGDVEFISINHKKINILLFYKNGITYYITISSKTKSISTLINKIKKLIIQG